MFSPNDGRALQEHILGDFSALPQLVHLILKVVDSSTPGRHDGRRLDFWGDCIISTFDLALQIYLSHRPEEKNYPRYISVGRRMLSLRIAESSTLDSGERGISYERIRGREKEEAVMALQRMREKLRTGFKPIVYRTLPIVL